MRDTLTAMFRRHRTVRFVPWVLMLTLLGSCGGGGSDTPPPAPLAITSSSLPNARVGSVYSAQLAARGGTAPYSWTLLSGPLPTGLTLDGTSGVISGTPSAAVAARMLTFAVTDAESPPASASMQLSVTVIAPLAITTAALPSAQVAVPYSQTLSYSGGAGAVSWTLTAGTLPKGLTLSAASGLIAGTPTIAAQQVPLTFTAIDAENPPQTQHAAYTLTINPSTISVAVAPGLAGLTVGQTLALSASTNDAAGVIWSSSPAGGSFSAPQSLNGAQVGFTAPSSAGVYTLTATSVSDTTRSASATVGVTGLAGVYTYRDDLARDGANTQEYALTPANVNTTSFGKLFSCTVDGAIFGQPLWVANLNISGVTHNVVIVVTEHDSVFAFDADASSCELLWQDSLLPAGEETVPVVGTAAGQYCVGLGDGDNQPEVGITGTPVIDPVNSVLYVMAKSMIQPVAGAASICGYAFYQRLHALDLASGAERAGSPIAVTANYLADNGTSVAFSQQQENQRAGLALVGGTVYIGWGSHEDALPWYGWLMGYSYNGAAFTQQSVLNVAPNTAESGIWMGGGAPSADSNGHLYVITGNGPFDAANTSGTTDDYGDSFLQLMPGAGQSGIGVSSFFTPSDQSYDNTNDKDFGSGGSALVLNLSGTGTAGNPAHLVVGGGKDGALYVLNGDQMGGSGDGNAVQKIDLGSGIFTTSAFWNNTLYIAPVGSAMLAYSFDSTTLQFGSAASSMSISTFGFPGSGPAVSASGTSNGIVWAINSHSYCTPRSQACGPALLHAYLASDLGTELWNSSMVAGDAAGNAVKFTVPTVANGKVYIGTRGNNIGGIDSSTTVPGELDVYGLKPN